MDSVQGSGSEYQLLHTKLFKAYEKIVEGHLLKFASTEDLSKSELIHRIKESAQHNSLAQLLVDLICCTTDFRLFSELMKIKRNEQEIIAANRASFDVDTRVGDTEEGREEGKTGAGTESKV